MENKYFPTKVNDTGTSIATLNFCMKDQQFDDLMQKYCGEVETQKAEEFRRLRRAIVVGRIRKTILVLMLAGAGFAGFQHRGQLMAEYTRLFPKTKVAEAADAKDTIGRLNVGAASKSKLREVQQNTDKRNVELENLFK